MFSNINIDSKCKNELESTLNAGRLSHAVILEGSDEKSRREAAFELAAAILCTGENKPCGKCPACIKAYAKSHPDMHFLEKAKDSTSIKVNEIRELKQKAALLPNDGNKSVFIIFEAQDMGIPAQNAILKIFEEPAKHISFILTCNSKSCFLDTVISRAASYNLMSEDGLTTDKESSTEAFEKANELLSVFALKGEYEFLISCAPFQKNKELFSLTLTSMGNILRDALVISLNSGKTITQYEETAKKLSMHLTSKKLMECINCLQALTDNFNSTANYNLTVTRLSSVLYGIKSK